MKPVIAALIQYVSDATGVTPTLILSRSRQSEIARARAIVCYIAHNVLGMALVEVGRSIDRDHSSVLNACRNIEQAVNDGRESRNFIAKIVSEYEQHKANPPTNLIVDNLIAAFDTLSADQKVLFLARVATSRTPVAA